MFEHGGFSTNRRIYSEDDLHLRQQLLHSPRSSIFHKPFSSPPDPPHTCTGSKDSQTFRTCCTASALHLGLHNHLFQLFVLLSSPFSEPFVVVLPTRPGLLRNDFLPHSDSLLPLPQMAEKRCRLPFFCSIPSSARKYLDNPS